MHNWENFDWSKIKKELVIKNVQQLVNMIAALETKSQKNLSVEDIKEILEEKSLVGVLERNQNMVAESLANQDLINNFYQNYCWINIFCKNNFFPAFIADECLYFKILPKIYIYYMK